MTTNTVTNELPTRIFVPGTYNLRAVDSLTLGSANVADGRLYRSDALHAIDEEGLQWLKELGIRRILDLRSDDEVLRRPDRMLSDAEYVRVPMTLVEPEQAHDISLDLTVLYAELVRDHGVALTRAVAELVVPDDGPVLVHCTAGKDRTGLVIALALLAVGIDEEAIVIDYARTESHLVGAWTEEMLSELRINDYPVTAQMIKVLNGSPADTMTATIALLKAEFGGARHYLAEHGMTSSQFHALERFLLDARQPNGSPKENIND